MAIFKSKLIQNTCSKYTSPCVSHVANSVAIFKQSELTERSVGCAGAADSLSLTHATVAPSDLCDNSRNYAFGINLFLENIASNYSLPMVTVCTYVFDGIFYMMRDWQSLCKRYGNGEGLGGLWSRVTKKGDNGKGYDFIILDIKGITCTLSSQN